MALSDNDLALLGACENGDTEKVRALLGAGADPSARGNGGWTPLHYAAGKGHADITTLLLAAGADVAARSGGGWTPLHTAASYGSEGVIKPLLDAGADPTVRDGQGRTPKDVARKWGSTAAADLLCEAAEAAEAARDRRLPGSAPGTGNNNSPLLESLFLIITFGVGLGGMFLIFPALVDEFVNGRAAKLERNMKSGAVCAKILRNRDAEGFNAAMLGNDCPPLQDDGGLRSKDGRLAVRLLPATDGRVREYEVALTVTAQDGVMRRETCAVFMRRLDERKRMFTRVTLNGRVIHPANEGSPGESEDYGCVDGENTLTVVGI